MQGNRPADNSIRRDKRRIDAAKAIALGLKQSDRAALLKCANKSEKAVEEKLKRDHRRTQDRDVPCRARTQTS